MALVKCKECGNEVAKSAKACPKCGHPRSGGFGIGKLIKGAVGAALILVIIIAVTSSGKSAKKKLENNLNINVAEDTIEEYQLLKKNGDKMGACIRAGIITEAYLSAKDEAKWKEWKTIEKSDCKKAGL